MQAANEITPQSDTAAATILVAEDEVILRMILCDHLRAHGFHVLEAANGEEARKIMASVEGVDVLVSDVHMAHAGEGLALAVWMAARYPRVPVILTSGSVGVQAARAWEASSNVTDFVPKPYSPDAMQQLVCSRIGSRDTSSS